MNTPKPCQTASPMRQAPARPRSRRCGRAAPMHVLYGACYGIGTGVIGAPSSCSNACCSCRSSRQQGEGEGSPADVRADEPTPLDGETERSAARPLLDHSCASHRRSMRLRAARGARRAGARPLSRISRAARCR